MRHVDLNCDLGESFGALQHRRGRRVMRRISSANVACGFHAGDPAVMRRTVRLAREAGVAVGAHPGIADSSGFGRREMRRDAAAKSRTWCSIRSVRFARSRSAEGVSLRHVKAHGALYNMAARDRGACRGDRARRPRGGSGVDPVRTRRIRDVARGERRRAPDRGRRICRPHLRAGRVADPAAQARSASSRTRARSCDARCGWPARTRSSRPMGLRS